MPLGESERGRVSSNSNSLDIIESGLIFFFVFCNRGPLV